MLTYINRVEAAKYVCQRCQLPDKNILQLLSEDKEKTDSSAQSHIGIPLSQQSGEADDTELDHTLVANAGVNFVNTIPKTVVCDMDTQTDMTVSHESILVHVDNSELQTVNENTPKHITESKAVQVCMSPCSENGNVNNENKNSHTGESKSVNEEVKNTVHSMESQIVKCISDLHQKQSVIVQNSESENLRSTIKLLKSDKKEMQLEINTLKKSHEESDLVKKLRDKIMKLEMDIKDMKKEQETKNKEHKLEIKQKDCDIKSKDIDLRRMEERESIVSIELEGVKGTLLVTKEKLEEKEKHL